MCFMPCNYVHFMFLLHTLYSCWATSFIMLMWTELFVWICFQGCHWPRPFQYYRNTAESSKMSRCSTANKYGSAIIMSMNVYVVRFLSKSLKYMDYLYSYLTCFSPSNRCHSATTSFSTWLRMELNCCLTPAIRDWRWEVTCVREREILG